MLLDAGRRVVVPLALYGFVLHVLFGKAYALVPSYFDRPLAAPRAPLVQLPLSVLGAAGIALSPVGPGWVGPLGAGLWAAGVAVFVATLGWTLRDNLTGAATGTGGANAHREPVDRAANAVVPVALGYLVLGTGGHLWTVTGGAPLATMQASHLLAAGTAALFVFGVGFRLFPRFLVASPPRTLVAVVLPTGAAGPALLGVGLFDPLFVLVGGAFEAFAVVGFALAYLVLFARSDRRRVGFYAVLVAVLAGVAGVALALATLVVGRDPALVSAHYRTMLLGFLGLTAVGAAYQFYPPSVGQVPFASDRTALVSIALLAGGLAVQVGGGLTGLPVLQTAGEAVALGGALLYAWLLNGAFARQRG
ncbi:hypothetical protein ACFQGE_09750 [Halomicroarcula sp. GCM10025817]|uniref:hypothetical protein n=1 Tax=Halomicroarcula sp. GCM10025817 TaxID=3252672 RepID=UPI003615F614